jgi:polysaccharide export outer membrane protein
MNAIQLFFRPGPALKLTALVFAAAAAFSGCDTMPTGDASPGKSQLEKPHSEAIILREGDTLKITFPGSPNLDTTQPIRRDGKLNLPLIGEMDAAGLSPAALQEKLLQAYASQISTKEVMVQVESSTFPVFVSGSVVHPGKILSDHPMTALEAVMEAGGFIYETANMKEVRIVREENGVFQHFVVNLKSVLKGEETKPFYLKPNDIIYVPERFSPF